MDEERTGASELIGSRYEPRERLGRGGAAVVHLVRDRSDGRLLALKQLRVRGNERSQRRAQELFEREFHTLAQLAHPRIVRALDYRHDEDGAFYTLELLDGDDLRAQAPIPWKRTCELLCDVCSALSLLHSRRLVHRDLTPSNVRCTADGKAKLFDLGALMPVGPCKQIVGTPPFIAPEVVYAQYADARTDLFALGATAYYALTGRHAYPARKLSELQDVWRSKPTPPSMLVVEIPRALDDLVMALLQQDAIARPTSAAEVMERLSAIGGFEIDERLRVQSAYLQTPVLTGRADAQLRLREHALRAVRGRGAAVAVTGAPGVGRSRFLDASVLEGKLLGALVLRADASDAAEGEWSTARALLQRLLQAAPELGRAALERHGPALAHAAPDLVEGDTEPTVFDGPQEQRARVTEALHQLFVDVADHVGVMLAIDDLERLDEPSAALVASLALEAHRRRLLVVATFPVNGGSQGVGAAALMRETGATIRLGPLSHAQTDELVISVFGDVPNVRLLADRLYAVAAGNPRATMRLAQHLLDRGLVGFRAGVWVLPETLDLAELPASHEDALVARVQRLSEDARTVGRALALSTLPGLELTRCGALLDSDDSARVSMALDELVSAGIVSVEQGRCGLAHPSWTTPLLHALSPEQTAPLHQRLATLAEPNPGGRIRCAVHLVAAGQHGEALDELVPALRAMLELTVSNPAAYYDYGMSLPHSWFDTFQQLRDFCDRDGRPALQHFEVVAAIAAFAAITARWAGAELLEATEQLRHASGLDILESLGAEVPETGRLAQALGQAQARFDDTPEHERTLAPVEAIQRLARMTVLAIGLAGRCYDRQLLMRMPSLQPFAALSPAIPVVENNRKATLDLLAGRLVAATRRYASILEKLGDAPAPGLGRSNHTAMRDAIIYALGMREAAAGLDASHRAKAIEHNPLFEASAHRMRVLQAYRQGDSVGAEQLKQHLELLRIRNRPPQLFEGSYLWTEVLCHAAADDLVRVRQVLAPMEAMARDYPGWVPMLHYARAQYQRLRGDLDQALIELERALGYVTPGEDMAWPPIAAARVQVLVGLGRGEEALEHARRDHAAMQEAQLEGMFYYAHQALAQALAAVSELEKAAEHADLAIGEHEAIGAGGAQLGIAHELRARVALQAEDEESFRIHAARCAQLYRSGRNPVLTAKYQRLMREADRRAVRVSEDLRDAAEATAYTMDAQELTSVLGTVLSECRGPDERARRALAFMVEQSGSAGGHLYVLRDDKPVLVAQVGSPEPPPSMDTAVAEYVSAELEVSETVTATAIDSEDSGATTQQWRGPDGGHFVPAPLSHPAEGGRAMTGLAVLLVRDASRFAPRGAILEAVSRSLHDSGDAEVALVAS